MNKSMKRLWYILLLAVIPWFSLSCEKENYVGENEVKLEFSVDTVAFDTLFTTIGSTTRQVKVYNRSNRDVVIGSITLADGRQSPFRLNVDGDTSMVARNVEIMAGDSIFIFIQANLRYDTIHTLPFVVSDAIMFSNGQRLPVSAWGRNAVYHRAPAGSWVHVIDCDNWDHTRPHVFLDTAAIDSTFTLTLNAGEELYFANNAMLLVWRDGRLVVNGTADNPVVFTSLRHDGWYSFLPGQWSCILFYDGSTGNVIDHAVVENGTGGLRAMYGAEVTVSNSVVRNMSDCGLIGQGATLTGSNLLVYDCLTSFLVMDGGNYSFTGCTFADYWRYSTRSLQSVVLTNYILNSDGSVASTGDLVAANFTDCIIYGNYGEGEYLVAGVEGVLLNDSIVNCLIKGGAWDEDPMFEDVENDNYRLRDGSPAAGIGYQYDN